MHHFVALAFRPDLQSDLLTAVAHLCLKSKRLMFPQESIVCSSLPFLFLMEQMERQSLADLGKGNHFWGLCCSSNRGQKYWTWSFKENISQCEFRQTLGYPGHWSPCSATRPTWDLLDPPEKNWWKENQYQPPTVETIFIILSRPVCFAFLDTEVLSHGTYPPWIEYLYKCYK